MDDPLGFDSADRETEINHLKRQLEQLSRGPVLFGPQECAPDIQESFLKHVLAFETAPGIRPLDLLRRDGIHLKPLDEMSDRMLARKLWELIRALARYRLFIERTNHLSNRELYGWIWESVLPGDYPGLGEMDGNWHVDVLGGCSDEDLILSMRFYASAEERARWKAEFPDFPMPPMEKPPYDRDRRLPQPDWPV